MIWWTVRYYNKLGNPTWKKIIPDYKCRQERYNSIWEKISEEVKQ